MRRSDDVFFFTLIDFLIQVFFFGFLLYVVGQAARYEANKKLMQVDKLVEQTGVSNLTELTDYLTKLAPVKQLKGVADFVSSAGGVENIKKTINVVMDHGGLEKVATGLERLRKLEEGSGKPPCLYVVQSGKRIAQSVGHVRATDTNIVFLGNTPELQSVLRKVGASYADVKELTLSDFRKKFSELNRLRPDCRYQLDVEVKTQLLAPMDAIWAAFSTRRR